MFDTTSPHPSSDVVYSPSAPAAPSRAPRTDRVVDRPADMDRPIALIRDADRAEDTQTLPALTPKPRSQYLLRALNVTIAGIALVILAPVMLLVAIAIKLSSPGPVIYAQTRVGQDRRRRSSQLSSFDRRACDLGGRVFRIYKFRTMRIDAERRGVQWATKNDPRVTRLGGFLRKCRLDELPQLFNVLNNDMNIVGPRPERPSIVRRLAGSIEEYPLRHWAKPGITGLAQINLAYDTCLDDVRAKVRYDLAYIERQSMAEDLRIMLCTMPAMLFRKGGW
jgi:lipopolysaccharide/colanic/teichoic acid biosynthesis glycosyltransferase